MDFLPATVPETYFDACALSLIRYRSQKASRALSANPDMSFSPRILALERFESSAVFAMRDYLGGFIETCHDGFP